MVTQGLLRDGDRYELLGELASGGMATVYLARMQKRSMGFSRLVAIKCMHPQFAKDESFVSMFMDEARLTARLRHPNIVPTLDIVAEDGHLLLVMEYVDGTSLANLLRSASKAGCRIPVPIACAIVHDMLLGLHEAHEAKDDEGAPLAIIHRDVSPQNVLVGIDGLSRVLDFGVAKARQNTHRSNDNEIKGKIPYMPPEQLFGEAINHRVDVYAAGVTLWEALVCERLFDGPSETALVKKISEEPIAKPSSRITELPPALDAIVMKALSREAHERFGSALEMAEAIAQVIKLPTRTEVSAWVRQFITPKEIPSGPKLASNASILSSSSAPVIGIAEVRTNPATTILAILEKASMLRPSAKRPVPVVPGRTSANRTTRFAIGVAAVAFAVAGVAVARVAKSEASPARPASAPIAQQIIPAAVTPAPTLAPAPATNADENGTLGESHPAAPAVVAQPAARKVTSTPSARVPAAKTSTSEKVAAPTKASCAIPFTVDSKGFKHFKEECVN